MNMWLAREGISLHRRHRLIDGIAILGCGGALPYYGRYVFSESQLGSFLQEAVAGLDEATPKLLLCHQPPFGTKLDIVDGNQHVGSKAVRDFIEAVQPLICFCGHIHGATGIDSIGKTQIINPGPIWASQHYAYAEVEAGEVVTLELRKVEKLTLTAGDE